MKKIAFITPSFYPSILTGSGIVVMKLAEEFVKSGYDVSVITSNALTNRYWYDPLFGKKIVKKSETFHGIKIYRMSCNQLYSSLCFIFVRMFHTIIPKNILNKLVIESAGPYFMGLKRFLLLEEFDVIHCSPSPLAINMQTVKVLNNLKRKPEFIVTPFFHSEIYDFANPELKKVFVAADKIHAITQSEKSILQKRFDIHAEKINVVSLFLDTKDMHSNDQLQKDVAVFKRKYKLEKKQIILFAGIKGDAKGAISLLSAVNELHKKNPEYILIAMGTATKEWNQTKKLINPGCLLDLGYKTGKEKEIVFSSCDVFCMPSKSESFGLVYLEAWHKKKPVIAASTPSVKEFLGDDAVLVEFGNRLQIIKAMQKLIKDKIARKKLGENGYNTLMETYTFKKVFSQYIQLFSD